MPRIDDCQHQFQPLGIQIAKQDEKGIEVVAVIFCSKCTMFRTKLLYIDRYHETRT